VELDADRQAPCDMQEGIDAIAAAGIPVWLDARVRRAHEKALVIDREVTIMGSYNFSAAAARNSEDLNVATSPEVAATYGEGARDIADNHLAFSIGNSRSPYGADTGWPALRPRI
jgi:phosphatidylserine/phosphatidylglycerophosphate/cardiolipin synthase-like enzyme